MSIDTGTVRENLLERQIDAVKDSISRSRTTWLFATLFTFVIAAAVFNNTMSYNDTQIERRAIIVEAVNRQYADLRSEISRLEALRTLEDKDRRDLTNEERTMLDQWRAVRSKGSTMTKVEEASQRENERRYAADAVLMTALVRGSGQLGYLARAVPRNEQEVEKHRTLRRLAAADLQAHIARGTAFDTVQIPLLGLSVAGSDIGIVGGLALVVIGYWLLAALRGEAHAFGEFIRKEPSGRHSTAHSQYSREENAYAFGAIRHYMIFSVSSRESLINVVTIVGFLIPPLLVMCNHYTTASAFVSGKRPEFGSYLQPHVIAELVIMIGVVAVWLQALRYQWRTVRALQAWRQLIESYSVGASNISRIRLR